MTLKYQYQAHYGTATAVVKKTQIAEAVALVCRLMRGVKSNDHST